MTEILIKNWKNGMCEYCDNKCVCSDDDVYHCIIHNEKENEKEALRERNCND
jgi:hypothetical protein